MLQIQPLQIRQLGGGTCKDICKKNSCKVIRNRIVDVDVFLCALLRIVVLLCGNGHYPKTSTLDRLIRGIKQDVNKKIRRSDHYLLFTYVRVNDQIGVMFLPSPVTNTTDEHIRQMMHQVEEM